MANNTNVATVSICIDGSKFITACRSQNLFFFFIGGTSVKESKDTRDSDEENKSFFHEFSFFNLL
jgi:hypothetical protein